MEYFKQKRYVSRKICGFCTTCICNTICYAPTFQWEKICNRLANVKQDLKYITYAWSICVTSILGLGKKKYKSILFSLLNKIVTLSYLFKENRMVKKRMVFIYIITYKLIQNTQRNSNDQPIFFSNIWMCHFQKLYKINFYLNKK